jgi:hypothetical protein
MDAKEKIIGFIRINGPSLPTGIAKKIEEDSFFVSAHLSELKEMGKIKISNVKVGGGSPLYYLPGQEAQLQKFSDNLGEKEKKVYDLLSQKKILRDSSLVPVFRAAIRSIKDFAFPFTVNINGRKEIFWKWYTLANEEAGKLVRDLLGIKKEEKKEEKRKEVTEEIKPGVKEEEINKETQTEDKKLAERPKEKQAKLGEKPKPKSNFEDELRQYFDKNKIKILEENIIRKNSDIDFIVEVPSSVGSLKYYVKAKSKKKINDGDLSTVFIQAQTKRLPALFLGKGDLTKKAEEMLESEFKGMKFNKI